MQFCIFVLCFDTNLRPARRCDADHIVTKAFRGIWEKKIIGGKLENCLEWEGETQTRFLWGGKKSSRRPTLPSHCPATRAPSAAAPPPSSVSTKKQKNSSVRGGRRSTGH